MSNEAPQQHTTDDPEWDALLRRTRTLGRLLGVESEASVERLADEFRRQKRRQLSDDSHSTE
jgi:hypothetical protein